MTTIPAYTIGGLTRPELQLDSTGHIVLDSAASAFAAQYGLQYLYLGCPPGTLWPPVTDSLSTPVSANSVGSVAEGAAVNTLVNITAQATSSAGNPVTYSLTGDSSNGGFKIDPNTGVVTVADPTKVNFVTSPGHAYTVTVQASDGVETSSQNFTIDVTDVAPSTPVDSNAAPNKVPEGSAAGTLVGITASSTDMNAVTYSLTGDSSGGGFKIDPHTGVVTVADPSKIDYTTAPGHAYTVTVQASDGTLTNSQTFTIGVTLGAATHFAVSIPASGTAGAPGSVTVTALDALNHVVTNYTGTVHFTSSDGHAVLPANMTLTNGVGTFSETLDTAGNQTITATDSVSPGITGTSNAETVTSAALTHFAVSIPAHGAAGTAGSVTITALDAFNNVVTGYSGTVHLTSSDSSAVLPANVTLTNGTGTFSETFETAGNQTITANDLIVPAITGTSNTEIVTGGAATHLVVSIPASGSAGTPGSVTVTALDAFGNVATGYTGTVHFTSTDGSAVLPANMTLTNGVGTFAETLDSLGNQTITATDTVNAAITGTSNSETVVPGPPTHFTVSIPANGTAGVAGSVTVTALDALNHVVTGYTGTVHFTSSDGQAVLPANMTLTNGVGTFTETLDTAGSQTITATDTVTSTITGTSNSETVGPAAATHLVVNIPASGTAGVAGALTVTALDQFGNVATGYSGTVDFTSSDVLATLPAPVTLSNGTGTFTETFKTSGNQTVTATDTVSAGITGTSNNDAVHGAGATHFVVTIPANGSAGTPGSVTVTAFDQFGNVATGYTGTVHFTSSDGQAVLPTDMTLTNGVGTFSETLDTVGNQTITATDTTTSSITGTSNSEVVLAGAATHFSVSIPASGTAGVAGLGTVTALDAHGNTVTGYTGTVHFTSSDGSAVLPADMTLTNGVATFSETLDTAGHQTIIATDTVSSGITGTSNSETVTSSAATHFAVSIPASGTAGTAGSATVTALDAFNNVVTGYSGTVHFTSSDGSAVLPANATLTNGTGTFSETLDTAGNQTITATDTVSAGITGTSNSETVAPGAATHFTVSIPANGRADIAGSVTVTALDAHGNIATGYTGTVHFTSSDGSAVLPADATLTNGVGTFSDKFETTGSQTITATDTASAGITGTSNSETVAPPDVPPVVTGGHTLNYLEGQAATAFDPALTVTDSDSANLAHATVQITGNYVSGQDVLGFVNTPGITGTFDPLSGTLTLTGSDTVAHYQAALDSVTYFDGAENPSGAARTVTIIANDGILDSSPATDTISVTPVNDPPVVTIGAITNFSEPPVGTPPANSVPVTIAPNLTISDVDSSNLISATFELNDLKPSDALSISGHAGTSGDIGNIHFDITSTATTETVTLTGTDTIAHYNAVLDAVQFNNTGEPPDQTARSYTVTAVDDGGTANGGNDTGSAAATQTVTAIDDPPTATVPSDSSVGTAFSHTNLAISGLSVADIDAAGGNETATISSSHGALSFDTTGLASFTNNNSHTVTLTGTIAQLNTALATLTYNSDDAFTGADTVSLNVNDNGNTGTGGPLTSGAHTFHVGVVPQVFYIDNSTTGTSANLGTQHDPFTSIAAFNAANPAGSGDYVVLEHGTGTYSEANGINLANGVNLIGGSQTLQFTNPVTSAVVTANVGSGTDPVIKLTSGSTDNGIDLLGTSGHTIQHVSVDTSLGGGMGISDDNNNVGTVAITDVVIKTASGAGMNFTHGGTLTVTGTGNSITTTTGTALDVANTSIGSSGLTFHDISVNGAANGIILNNTGTGASNGGLTVTGDGATAGSGGTIQNNVEGALFTNTKALSLSYMNFTNPDSGQGTVNNADDPSFNINADAGINMSGVSGVTLDHLAVNGNGGSGGVQTGINGINVSNLTISNSTVVGFGDQVQEGNVRLFNLSGTSNITNSTFGFVPGDSTAGENLVDIRNNIGTLTLNVTGSLFHNTADSANGSDGLQMTSTGTAVVNLNASGDTFTNLKTAGIDTFAKGTSTMNVNITDGGTPGNGNSFTPGSVASRAIGLNAQDTAHLNFNINRNETIKGYGGPVVEIFGINSAVINGHVDNNGDIENNGTTNLAGSPLDFDIEDNATAAIEASGNTIKNAGQDAGIVAFAEGDGGTTNNKAALDLTLANNTINMTGWNLDTSGNNFNDAILLVPGANANDATTMVANVHNNTVTDNATNTSGAFVNPGLVAFVNENTGGAGSHLYLEGFTTDTNTTWNVNGNTPQNSTLEANSPGSAAIPGTHNGGHTILPSNPNALFSGSGGVASTTGSTGETNLTQAELNKVVAAAISDWAAAGLSPDKVAALQHVTYDVADITSGWLGQSTSGHVTIDVNADGHGWFVDPTPSDNSEFAHAASATSLVTDPTTAAAGHMDLLTTVMHEMGEQLGLQDMFAPADQGSLMYAFLSVGERALPSAADVAQANQVSSSVEAVSSGASSTNGQIALTNQPVTGGPSESTGGTAGPGFSFAHFDTSTPPPATNITAANLIRGDSFDFSAFTSTPSQHTSDAGQTMDPGFTQGNWADVLSWHTAHSNIGLGGDASGGVGGFPIDNHAQPGPYHHDLIV